MQTSALSENNGPDFKSSLLWGFGTLAVFLASFFIWSITAKLDSSAIAPGIISVEYGRKTVAHLEGGIVGTLQVKEGEQVKAGQVLITLNNENSLATYQLLKDRILVAQALKARLDTEYKSLTHITFPDSLHADGDKEALEAILNSQRKIFWSRQESLNTKKQILTQRITQLGSEIKGIEGQLNSELKQSQLLHQELRLVDKMYKEKVVDKPHWLQVRRKTHEIDGKINMHRAQIAKAEQSIGETELKILEIDSNHNKEVAEELRAVESELLDLNNRLQAALDVHNRSTIKAPIDGIVVGLKINTPGGVILPGEPLLEIVPDHEGLIIEAKVNPNDIDVVHQGMLAQMRLTAFNQRTTPLHQGTVETISADHLTDELTGENYYLARIKLDQAQSSQLLRPGMKAEVMIITGERTFMNYLLEPITNSFNKAFRET
ncbi:HlyD family type I secretion periplasmic adaptor subunit [Neptuniibacter sp. QD37_6]|uniref:HlyD family type I secretion periplasmic adaptor subunit n=1 Tax=Neptuniibacter sp. QD37_6 TaxID=3398210 RepID=UPI0039F4A4CC